MLSVGLALVLLPNHGIHLPRSQWAYTGPQGSAQPTNSMWLMPQQVVILPGLSHYQALPDYSPFAFAPSRYDTQIPKPQRWQQYTKLIAPHTPPNISNLRQPHEAPQLPEQVHQRVP